MIPAGFWNQCRSYCGHGSQCVYFRGHPWGYHFDDDSCAWPDEDGFTETEADRAMIENGMPVIWVIRDRMAEITYLAVYGDGTFYGEHHV